MWYSSRVGSSQTRTNGFSRRSRCWQAGALAVGALLVLTMAEPVLAQQPVGGVVIDAVTQRPLPGAQVAVEGTQLGALADNQGRFMISNVPGDEVSVRVQLIGYRAARQTVAPGRTDLRFELTETALALDEIVVTGTAGGQARRAIGNAVGRLAAADIQEIAPAAQVHQMLSAQIPGVRIMNTGGEVGAGGVARIRGASSLSLAATPLIYIDGVRVLGADNMSSSFGFAAQRQPSRMNDLSPEDIETIEVIKGPAAATLYGTEASNGVIHIITKKGAMGTPRVNARVSQGATWIPDPYNTFPSVFYRCTGVSQAAGVHPLLQCTPGEITEANILALDRDVHGNEWFQRGHNQGYGADVGGGTQEVSYYGSVDWDRNEGALPYNWSNRLTGRASLGYRPSEAFNIDFNVGTIRSRTQSASAQQPLSTAIIWGCPGGGCEAGSGLPGALDGPFRGYIAYLPEAYENDIEGFQDLDRTTIGVSVDHSALGWFNQRLTVGGDFGNIRNSDLYRATGNIGNTQPQGRKRVANINTSYTSFDYRGSATFEPTTDLQFVTSGGFQYYRRQEEISTAEGSNFPLEALETISSGAVRFATGNFVENSTVGVYIQEQLGWRDRLFITGAIRADDNSAFGENFEFVTYPKLSTSWVLSEEPFLQNVRGLNSLRVRSAWGRAGQQPDVFDALRTYQPVIGPSGQGVVTPQNIGNPDLRPEVSGEWEVGLDAGILDERIALEFTVFNQNTRDALVRVPALPSLGFPGVQFQNLGALTNRGWEMALQTQVYRGRTAGLDLNFTLSATKSEVTDLGGQPPIVQSAALGQYHVEGFPLASIFHKRVVSADLAEVGGRNVAVNVMCEGGERVQGTNLSRGGGAPIACAEAPNVYWGQPLPEWEGSFAANLTLFGNVRVYGLVDFIRGRTIINNDVAAVHRTFLNSRAILERTDPILLGYEALGGEGILPTGILSGDFAKLRNVAVSYNVPTHFTERLGASRLSLTASGENLATLWQADREAFGHPVMDPERQYQTGTTPGLNAFFQEGWPQLRRFTTTVRVSF